MPADVVTMDKVVALCKRRGFIFPSSEIYGGLGSTYDYGHYGVLLKGNVKAEWWRAMLAERDVVEAGLRRLQDELLLVQGLSGRRTGAADGRTGD